MKDTVYFYPKSKKLQHIVSIDVPHQWRIQDFQGGSSQGGHGTGKTGNLVLTFSRQGKYREFCSDTGKNLLTQGKYLDCDY